MKSFIEIKPENASNGYINIATITRIVPIKDIKTMIQSFNYVKEKINARFFIIGPTDEDEDYFNECKRLVERLRLTSRFLQAKWI